MEDILPKGFVRIRLYGILSSTSKDANSDNKRPITAAVEVKKIKPKRELFNPLKCPCCKKETRQTLVRYQRRGPPEDWKVEAKNMLECVSLEMTAMQLGEAMNINEKK